MNQFKCIIWGCFLALLYIEKAFAGNSVLITDADVYRPKFLKILPILESKTTQFGNQFSGTWSQWNNKPAGFMKSEDITKWESSISTSKQEMYAIKSQFKELDFFWDRIYPYESLKSQKKFDQRVQSLRKTIATLTQQVIQIVQGLETLKYLTESKNLIQEKAKGSAQKKRKTDIKMVDKMKQKLAGLLKTIRLEGWSRYFASSDSTTKDYATKITINKLNYLTTLLKNSKALDGEYPADIEGLFISELNSFFKDVFNPRQDAWGTNFSYRKKDKICILTSAGKDRQFNTADDISALMK